MSLAAAMKILTEDVMVYSIASAFRRVTLACVASFMGVNAIGVVVVAAITFEDGLFVVVVAITLDGLVVVVVAITLDGLVVVDSWFQLEGNCISLQCSENRNKLLKTKNDDYVNAKDCLLRL
jgi:hypothetical protein